MTIRWAYGVTTVLERRDTLLPKTLKSLASAGFDKPRLFVDGCTSASFYDRFSGLSVTVRIERIRTHPHWVLSLIELFARNPQVERFALFQDDLVCYKNLREYLDKCRYPDRGYWNLYTVPENESVVPPDPTGQKSRAVGWFRSNQRGKGALALVFSNAVCLKLLSSLHLYDRMRDPHRGWQSVDGAVVTALQQQGVEEWIHNPSLVQHTGDVSTMGHQAYPKPTTFRGEDFSALELLTKQVPA